MLLHAVILALDEGLSHPWDLARLDFGVTKWLRPNEFLELFKSTSCIFGLFLLPLNLLMLADYDTSLIQYLLHFLILLD